MTDKPTATVSLFPAPIMGMFGFPLRAGVF
jgi:hypothetical protein